MFSVLRGLFVDNPVLKKDVGAVLQRRVMLGALGLIGVLGVTLVCLGTGGATSFSTCAQSDEMVSGCELWRGRDLAMTVLTIAGFLITTTTFVAGWVSVARERVHGTLQAMLLTGLAPSRIVAGKWLAISAPGLVLASLAGGLLALISARTDCVFLAALLGAVVLAAGAVVGGATTLGASAIARDERQAGALSALGILCVLLIFMPAASRIFAAFARSVTAAHLWRQIPELLLTCAGLSFAVTAGALFAVWSSLAPSSTVRTGWRLLTASLVLVVAPAITAVVTLSFEGSQAHYWDASRSFVWAAVGHLLLSLVVIVGLVLSDDRAQSGPRHRVEIIGSFLAALAGGTFVLMTPLAAGFFGGSTLGHLRNGDPLAPTALLLPSAATFFLVAGLAMLVHRLMVTTRGRLIGLTVALTAILIGPLPMVGVLDRVGLDSKAALMFHPAVLFAAAYGNSRFPEATAMLFCFGIGVSGFLLWRPRFARLPERHAQGVSR